MYWYVQDIAHSNTYNLTKSQTNSDPMNSHWQFDHGHFCVTVRSHSQIVTVLKFSRSLPLKPPQSVAVMLRDVHFLRPLLEVEVTDFGKGQLDPGVGAPTLRSKHLQEPWPPVSYQQVVVLIKVHTIRTSLKVTCQETDPWQWNRE